MELDLGEIRKNIDAIDDQLLELFKQRMGLTRKVAEYKAAHNMVVFQSEREKAIIRSVRDRSPEELKSSAEFLFTNIMDISKCGQNNAITPAVSIPHGTQIKHTPDVAVQGIEGAYGHAAAQKLFPDGRMNFRASFAEVFEAVENGSADYGVIPVENSTAGFPASRAARNGRRCTRKTDRRQLPRHPKGASGSWWSVHRSCPNPPKRGSA